ncbi:hypothetical protein GEMRC1_007239 [Eukaryota sp. GEM-RC1]
MRFLVVIFLFVVFANCTLYQIQVHNRSTFTMIRTFYSTNNGRIESHPLHALTYLMRTNMSVSGTYSSSTLVYTADGQTATVRFGRDGCTCQGWDCRVDSVSSTSWKIYFGKAVM